ncbi:low molecular weight protein tyrosine phosphatase family protein [Montanilutibacter psychrotolerans]|uniref:low molecular weight protein tyrosine phosphatase family protein n=1 Tax=Montanilutibacter psychrotolerans TaxID=1327343 RepID=UPI001CC201DE|nr:phosphotyrosine protein phosphatase [Lysobacter psychrotolerans]
MKEHKKAPTKVRNVLFVCSRNQWRSPTAEQVWKRHPAVRARSAGTSPNARRPISAADVQWADVIVVMENKHRDRVVAQFAWLVEHKAIHVLGIPDEYKYMDPELMEELTQSVGALLDL